MEPKFKFCSECGKKISFFRKFWAKQKDKDPMHMIPLTQFCSDECADIVLNAMLKRVKK